MISNMKKFLLLMVLGTMSIAVKAQVAMSQLFTDNMVLQRESEVPLWGKAKPGKPVHVITSWDNKEYFSDVTSDGKWEVKVNTPTAGGPYTITITQNRHTTTIHNVMSGDVWLCSGQSNMEMPVGGWGEVLNYKQEIKDANNYGGIRLLNLEMMGSAKPKEDFNVKGEYGWNVCNEFTVNDFSACAYFFGRELYRHLDIPIGLINTSYGGTNIEAWMNPETISTLEYEQDIVKHGREWDQRRISANIDSLASEWRKEAIRKDRGFENGKALWAAKNLDMSQWKKIHLPGDVWNNGLWTFTGSLWFRKEFQIPKSFAKHDLTFLPGKINDDDIVYFNGVKIGSHDGADMIREYRIPARLVKDGKAVIAVRCVSRDRCFGIMGVNGKIELTNGKERIDLAGDWNYEIGVSSDEIKSPEILTHSATDPSNQYNAMICPLYPYNIKGALWYQGEANVEHEDMYIEALSLLIYDWREKWGTEFPFYVVQLSSYHDPQSSANGKSCWAELREAQSIVGETVKDVHVAVSLDVGDAKDIHPKRKQKVGERLALLARKYSYGEDISADSPAIDSFTIEGSSIRIRFRNAKSLKTPDGSAPRGFTIAGGDHVFHYANAKIEGNEVIVSCPDVKYPLAVRYGWADNPDCNLYNETGLPAPSCRTDNWPN